MAEQALDKKLYIDNDSAPSVLPTSPTQGKQP